MKLSDEGLTIVVCLIHFLVRGEGVITSYFLPSWDCSVGDCFLLPFGGSASATQVTLYPQQLGTAAWPGTSNIVQASLVVLPLKKLAFEVQPKWLAGRKPGGSVPWFPVQEDAAQGSRTFLQLGTVHSSAVIFRGGSWDQTQVTLRGH